MGHDDKRWLDRRRDIGIRERDLRARSIPRRGTRIESRDEKCNSRYKIEIYCRSPLAAFVNLNRCVVTTVVNVKRGTMGVCTGLQLVPL